MGTRSPLVLVLLAVLVAGPALGCSGDTASSTSAHGTLDDPSRALLTRADLPDGWFAYEPVRAPGTARPAELRATADAPRYGYNPYVAHTVDVYAPGTGARAMDELRTLFRPGVTHAIPFPGDDGSTRLVRVLFWRTSIPRVGDDRFAVWFDAADGGRGTFIAVRRGDAISMIRHYTVGATGERLDGYLNEDLARRADELLAKSLGAR